MHVMTPYIVGRLLSRSLPLRVYSFSYGVVRLRRMMFLSEALPHGKPPLVGNGKPSKTPFNCHTYLCIFFIHLLGPRYSMFIQSLLRFKCHRTGKIYQKAVIPLYRLRWAISRLWNDYRPVLGCVFPPNLTTIQALAFFKRQNLS